MFAMIAVLCVAAIVVVALAWPSQQSQAASLQVASPMASVPASVASPASVTPAAPPAATRSAADAAWHKAEHVLLLAEEIADRHGAVPNWQGSRDERLLDLGLLIHEGLERISLDLFTANRKILVRYLLHMNPQGDARPDLFGDIEVPLLENVQLRGARLSVPSSTIEQHKGHLRTLPDTDLDLEDRTLEGFVDPHVRHRTNGVLEAELRVGLQPRRHAFVKRVFGDGRSAVAEVAGLSVFLHASHLLPNEGGGRKLFDANCGVLSCVVVQTPRGFQGRCIRAVRPQARR